MFIYKRHILFLFLAFLTLGILLSCNRTPPKEAENTLASASLPKSYTARGNEPFWSVTIQEPTIVFKTPEQEVSYPYAAPKEESNLIAFESSTASDTMTSTIRITISVSECFDSMSGEAFPYTATVTRDGTTYTGCAEENN